MEKKILGKTDLSVSRLGFGSAPIGFLETSSRQVAKLVGTLIDQGVNLFDTAAMYQGAEAMLGEFLKGRRDEVVLVSKCGGPDADLPGEDWSPQRITASIDRSLERLGTDHLDVVMLHSCDQAVLEQGDALGALLAARDAGKTRYLGYSGDNQPAACAAAMEAIDVVEMSINVADQHNIKAVLPVCLEHHVGVIAKRPIANAAWNPLNKQRGMYQEYARVYHERLKQMAITPHELGYHGYTEVEWPEIALKFTLGIEGVDTAIVGTTSTVNAQANLEAVSKNPLREEVVTKLREAFCSAQTAEGVAWLGQR